jgi:hypothetical protein
MTLLLAAALSQDPIAEWIKQLGSEDYAAREEAAGKLRSAGRAAVPPLVAAMNSKDPEVSARARTLLEQLAAETGLVRKERESSEALRRRLQERQISVNWNGTLGEAMDELGRKIECPVWASGREEFVGIKIANLSAESVLKIVLECNDLEAFVYHGVLIVGGRSEAVEWLGTPALPGPTLKEIEFWTLTGRKRAASLVEEVSVAAEYVAPAEALRAVIKDAEFAIDKELEKKNATLRFDKVPAHVALRLICLDIGADWTLDEGGTINVTSRK